MTTTTVKRTCDVCGKEMGPWDHGKLNLSYSVTDWAGNGAPAGIKFGRFSGEERYTTKESDRLVRLPMYYNIAEEDIDRVISQTKRFFCK